jgi:hypothetical protein
VDELARVTQTLFLGWKQIVIRITKLINIYKSSASCQSIKLSAISLRMWSVRKIISDVSRWDEHLQIRTLSRITQWTIVYFISRTFHLLQYCNPSVQSVDPLTPGKPFSKAQRWFLPKIFGFRKEVYLQIRIALLGGGFWDIQLRNKKKSEEITSGQYGGSGECRAIRTKLTSQNDFVTFAGCGLALSICTTNLFSPLF